MVSSASIRFFRSPAIALLVVSTAACAPSAAPSPKTVIDRAAPAATPTASDAAPAADSAQPQAEEVEPTAIAIEGSDLVEAKATVRVGAPIDKARTAILKFEDYPHFMPEYSDAKHVGKMPTGNDKVYMEIITLGGIAKMYANVEILPAVKTGPTETYEAKFLDGNVRQFKAIWTLTQIDEARTDLTLQVFLHPSIPLPDFLVNKANMDGAKKGALAMKRHILETL
jgi:ribosome-associated toxin RatA of RatAB toxin-antitoxin module